MPTELELITEVRDMLNEPVAAAFSNNQLRRWCSEANRDLARETRHYKSTDSITSIAGTAEYALDENIIAVEQAWYNDGTRSMPLTPRHIENMDRIWGERQDQEGPWPGYYMVLGYSPNHVIRLFPVPSYSAHTIQLITSILPTDLTGVDGAAVDVPPAWYDALAEYCTYKALQSDRDDRWQAYRSIYLEKRDAMLTRSEYHTANREVVADPSAGYLPRWLVEPEGW